MIKNSYRVEDVFKLVEEELTDEVSIPCSGPKMQAVIAFADRREVQNEAGRENVEEVSKYSCYRDCEVYCLLWDTLTKCNLRLKKER